MKYTIEKIKAMIAEHSAGRKALENEIADLLKQEAELAAQAEAAADTGNVDDYMDLSAKKNRATATIFVKRKQMDKAPVKALPDDVAREAWAEYAEDYNKALKKKLDEYASLKKKLCQMYGEMLDYQNEALNVRLLFSNNSAVPAEAFRMEYIPLRGGALNPVGGTSLNGCSIRDPDAVFFLSDYCIKNNVGFATSTGVSDPTLKKAHSVLGQHIPVKPDKE